MARQRIELAVDEAEELSRRSHATTVSVRDRRRAEIIVLSAQGMTQQRIAEQLAISRLAVNRWVGRLREAGWKGCVIVRDVSPNKISPSVTEITLDRPRLFRDARIPTGAWHEGIGSW